MSNQLNTIGSGSGNTANPQQLSQSSYQGFTTGQIQNSNETANLNTTSIGGSTETIKNFNASSLDESGQNSQTSASTNNFSPIVIVLICVLVLAVIAAVIAASRSRKITTK